MQIFYGVVENRHDPLQLGRCQVRVMSKHTADKLTLPTEQLPWAIPMQSINSAAMNGIGTAPVGLVPGTWVLVVFQDEDCQQPIMIGSVGGIPDLHTITSANDDDAIVIRDPLTGDASEQIVTTNVTGDVIRTLTDAKIEPLKPKKITGETNADTPTTIPPPGSVFDISQASAGIQAIITACEQSDYTDKNAVSAILGIVGGECGWILKEEDFTYKSASRLVSVFAVFGGDTSLAEPFVNNPSELPEYVYGYQSPKGSELGNIEPGDGAKYIGRGFIQLTGRANYKRYAKLSGVDIVENPSILSTDIEASAKVTVAYFKDRLSKNNVAQNDSRFFEAAVKAVGNNTIDIHAKKQKYYEYFLGAELGFESKRASPEDVKQVDSSGTNGSTILPGGDRTINTVLGFSDPEGKYPLRKHLHEPDTNRLARGQIGGTCVEIKDTQRTSHVPTAFGGSFDQPIPPYAATYPFNKVFESESGSVMEFDDTPYNERINLFHRTGTFTEIDANGTQVNKIVGDGYIIIERNGCVYVTGECNLTVDGNINILCNSTANIEVMASANIDVRSDANIGVYRDVTLGVGRNVKALINGNMTTKVGGNVLLDVNGNMSTKVSGNYDLCVGGDYKLSAATSSITSAGNTALQGSQVHLNTPGVAKAGVCASAPLEVTSIHIPAIGEVKGSSFKYLDSPPRGIGEDFSLGETPDEFDTNAATKMNLRIIGTKSTPANTQASESQLTTPNNLIGIPASCDLIMSTEVFQSSYVLSEQSNITLGTMLECPGNSATPQDTVISDTKGGEQYRITKQEIICNMKQVAVNILEMMYKVADGKNNIIVSSSFRLGGSSSDHDKGRAVDIQIRGSNYDYQAHYDLACALQRVLPYDQLILEYRDPNPGQRGQRKVWIHCSYRGDQNRKMAFTMLNDATYKRDANGQPAGFYLL